MKLLIVCGPTATGKTNLAITLAKTFSGELVNADSRQVYKGLDALTGKKRSEQTPIWLYDVVDTGQEFSVAHYVRRARERIDHIEMRGKLPIVVGGTGFYLRALTTSIETLEVPPNVQLRMRLKDVSFEELQQELKRVDTKRWSVLNDSDRANPRRLIRAIEVAMSGRHIPQAPPRYDALWIGLTAPLSILKQRIAQRVADHFDKALREVRDDLPPILGVEPLLAFRRGECTKEETLIRWIDVEYHYARRQMTWFRKEKDIHWFNVQNAHYQREVEALVREWYTQGV